MAFDNRRPDRVAEAIREEVAGFLADGVKDPRVRGLVTVTGVDLTRDLRHAKVFVSILGEDVNKEETLAGLAAVAVHLRGRVGRALRLRVAPEIVFTADRSVAHAARIETLLAQLQAEREGTPAAGAAADADVAADVAQGDGDHGDHADAGDADPDDESTAAPADRAAD